MEETYIYEYIWIDGFSKIRSKTRLVNTININLEWTFDGSSTGQGTTSSSDIILKPVKSYIDPFRLHKNSYILLCECLYNSNEPHITNNRNSCDIIDKQTLINECLFGIEQEYIIYNSSTNLPYGWENDKIPKQGPYYCGVGGNVSYGRKIVEEHLSMCIKAGLKICGVNAEVMPSQWQYQIGPLEATECADQLWVSRYILERTAESYNAYISYDPKPFKNLNSSGAHINFSTYKMRTKNKDSMEEIHRVCKCLISTHSDDIIYYGENNKKRYDKCNYAVSDRSASIRIPLYVNKNGYGYIEDRRPSSNMDPYLVIKRILMSVFKYTEINI